LDEVPLPAFAHAGITSEAGCGGDVGLIHREEYETAILFQLYQYIVLQESTAN
jgi:hypothetical protein